MGHLKQKGQNIVQYSKILAYIYFQFELVLEIVQHIRMLNKLYEKLTFSQYLKGKQYRSYFNLNVI